jgi:hypothetical protein
MRAGAAAGGVQASAFGSRHAAFGGDRESTCGPYGDGAFMSARGGAGVVGDRIEILVMRIWLEACSRTLLVTPSKRRYWSTDENVRMKLKPFDPT